MNVSRHIARDMRTALAMVRDLHGPDAVILSNRKVPEGIEITAAVDYDESQFEAPKVETNRYSFPLVDETPEKPTVSAKTDQGDRPSQAVSPIPKVTEQVDPDLDFTVELSRAAQSVSQHPPRSSGQANSSSQTEQIRKALPERSQDQNNRNSGAVIWTQESMLDDMRRELQSLKSLVETQISGFAWGDMSRRHPVRAGVLRKLVALGLSPAVARHIAYRIPEEIGHRKAWYRALAMFARQVPIAGDTLLTNGGVVALVGPAGVGKTTLIAKLAVQYAARHGRENVALITTDSNRFGAFDQLRNLGSVLKIPVQAAGTRQELEVALDNFMDRPLVLIDTAGLSHRDERLVESLETIRSSTSMLKAYLVLSATTQTDALEQMIKSYKPVDPCGCMITKVDESTSLGPVLSALVEHKLPLTYYSEGQKIPDDLKISQIQDLVGKAVAISKSMNAFDKTEDLLMEQILLGENP